MVAVLALAWGVSSWWLNRKTKLLTHEILSDTALLPTRGTSRWGDIQVVRDKTTIITNPRTLVVRFTNSGNTEIPAKLIDIPPQVKLVDGAAAIVDVVAQMKSRGDASLSDLVVRRDDDVTVSVDARLLNPGDWIQFHLLIDSAKCTVQPFVKGEGFGLEKRDRSTGPNVIRRSNFQRSGAFAIGLILLVLLTFIFAHQTAESAARRSAAMSQLAQLLVLKNNDSVHACVAANDKLLAAKLATVVCPPLLPETISDH